MKYQDLKKRLLIQSVMLITVSIVLGAGVYFLGDFSDDYQKENEPLEAKTHQLTATATQIRQKYDKIKRNMDLYNKIAQLQSQDGLTINQQIIKNVFGNFRDQYYLSALHISMASVNEMKEANYRRPSHVIVSSEVSVTFDGLSDEYAYGLLNAMQQDLQGASKVTKLTLTREGKVTDDILRTISEKGAYALIKGELKFTWLGINPAEAPDNAAAAAKKKP